MEGAHSLRSWLWDYRGHDAVTSAPFSSVELPTWPYGRNLELNPARRLTCGVIACAVSICRRPGQIARPRRGAKFALVVDGGGGLKKMATHTKALLTCPH